MVYRQAYSIFEDARYTTMSLTVRKIEKTRPGEKPIALSDGLGLELRISPNGSKGWRFRYVRPNCSGQVIQATVF
ncbi:Arm DNA-binding domain-containing protein [Kushneria aurantia]|uniref:Arm DNA-binding domain-containing protein n=1 Tax=Kushneria aurantia TaxID=504092 RepID=A0ABV6G6K7_9GAMM